MTEEEQGYTRADLEAIGAKWMDRIKKAEKDESKWIKEAENAEEIYSVDRSASKEARFNILHSNVETIVPSIYNSTPNPDIRPRHDVQDQIAKTVSNVFERVIATQIDDSALDQEIEAGAQDTFLAGRGIVRVKFDADVEEVTQTVEAINELGEAVLEEQAQQVVTGERVLYENVSWRDFRRGPAKRWDSLPWIAFRHNISEAERRRIEDKYLTDKYEADAENTSLDVDVWEVWCRETMKVYFVIEQSQLPIKIEEDPLGLSTFFPIATPVQPITKTGDLMPVCPYTVYRHLAEELDKATTRIDRIMSGLKVRGAIAADSSVVDIIAGAGDNEIVAVDNVENIAAAGGLDKAIMWWPVDRAIAVLQQLYQQREQTKQAIYEITGISDIIRGQSAASETATAQQIKTQWGSLRIKKMQRLIERQVRELFKLTAEIISLHFSVQTVSKAAGVQLGPEAAQFLNQPLDHYRIDVETDSTVRGDQTMARREMSEFLNGTAQFFSTMAPVVAQAPEAAGPITDLYAAFARQFNLGQQGEAALDQFGQIAKAAASKPKPEDPMAMAAKQQAELEMKKLEFDVRKAQADAMLKERELGIKEGELQLKEAEGNLNAATTAARLDHDLEEGMER